MEGKKRKAGILAANSPAKRTKTHGPQKDKDRNLTSTVGDSDDAASVNAGSLSLGVRPEDPSTAAGPSSMQVEPAPLRDVAMGEAAGKAKRKRKAGSVRDADDTAQLPQRGQKIRKLVPPRPFPTVPTSVSATGPRSAHTEGKNLICISRKTPLGAYLRRCKDVFLKDGYVMYPFALLALRIPLRTFCSLQVYLSSPQRPWSRYPTSRKTCCCAPYYPSVFSG